MNKREGIDKRRPKSFHTSRHRIRFEDEEDADSSPDETSKLREDFDEADNDSGAMNQGERTHEEDREDDDGESSHRKYKPGCKKSR